MLPLFRWDDTNAFGEELMSDDVNRPISGCRAGRILTKTIVTLPIIRGSDRSRHETTAAVRTNIIEDLIDTGRAERAFVATDARLGRVRRQ